SSLSSTLFPYTTLFRSVPNLAGEVYALYKNGGKGTFEFATDQAGLTVSTMAHSGWGVSFLDFDRDGWVDLVAANGHVNPDLDRRSEEHTSELQSLAYLV